MSAEEEGQTARSVRVWNLYQADRKFMRNNPPTWKPVMTEQQKKEHQQYMKDNQLPF